MKCFDVVTGHFRRKWFVCLTFYSEVNNIKVMSSRPVSCNNLCAVLQAVLEDEEDDKPRLKISIQGGGLRGWSPITLVLIFNITEWNFLRLFPRVPRA